MENTRAPTSAADQEVPEVRVAMPDQIREHVQLPDVARIDRVGGKTRGS